MNRSVTTKSSGATKSVVGSVATSRTSVVATKEKLSASSAHLLSAWYEFGNTDGHLVSHPTQPTQVLICEAAETQAHNLLFSKGVNLVADIGCELGHRGRDTPMPYNYIIVIYKYQA